MSNNFQDSFPHLQQMTDQFRKIFGDDFVKNLMGSMQAPNWWQQQNTAGPEGGMDGQGRFHSPTDPSGNPMANQQGAWPTGQPQGWNPFAAGTSQNPATPGAYPRADVYETRHEVVVVLEVPGVERSSDIRISVFPESILVKGDIERKYERTSDPLYAKERFSGAFERRLPLPVRVRKQHAKASYRSGLLEVRLLKEGKDMDGDGAMVDVDFL
jgi:HSP20 family protein